MRAVIIEDSKVMRQLIRAMLQKLDVEVIGEAEDGISGLEQVMALKPDLVTLDLHMPKADGKDLLKFMHTIRTDIKVIVVSAIESGEKLECFAYGADAIIEKPFTVEQFRSVLQAFE